jgi:hypothetical protein
LITRIILPLLWIFINYIWLIFLAILFTSNFTLNRLEFKYVN